MIQGENGYRVQSRPLEAARAHLQTLSEGDLDPLTAAAALSCIDSALPSYTPAASLAEGASFASARQLLAQAVEASSNVQEIGRLGDALDLLAVQAASGA